MGPITIFGFFLLGLIGLVAYLMMRRERKDKLEDKKIRMIEKEQELYHKLGRPYTKLLEKGD